MSAEEPQPVQRYFPAPQMGPMAKILEDVYLGAQCNERDLAELEKNSITHILQVSV